MNDDASIPGPNSNEARLSDTDDTIGSTAQAFLPKRIGRYRIRRVIASGGMGTVYEATQDEPHRTIALKVMRQGVTSKSALKRFEYESQTLARLRHPNIAQVYEAGTHRDEAGVVPFFAMEYIRSAKSITRFAEDGKLPLRDRLTLFAQVCETVHHGHEKGVIHRDLKPSNILVDSEGRMKIIDFGVARSTDSDLIATTSRRDLGQMIGTLQYMSPEQCASNPHDIDTRSDVYALGVVYFELLTGHPPYDLHGVAMYEATRIIRESPPMSLARLDKQLRGDVETIALKALQKDRERRYQSAADFAGDIHAYLNNEPIAAHPPSRMYQFRVLVRRNKSFCGSLTALFALLVAGATLSTSQYLRAESARREAEFTRAATQRDRSAAEQSRDDTRSVVRFLSEMLASVDPGTADGEVTIRAILDEAAKAVEERFTNRPLMEADLRHVIGASYYSLGHYAFAESHQTAAAAIRRRELGARNPQTLSSITSLAITLGAQGKFSVSGDMFRKNYEIMRRVLGEEHPETLQALSSLAFVLKRQGRTVEAESLQRHAVDIYRRVLGDEDPRTLVSMHVLATVLYELGRDVEAEKLQQSALETQVRLLGEEHPAVLSSLNNLANVHFGLGHYVQAEKLVRKALTIRRRILGEEHPATLNSLNNLANAIWGQGRYVEAEELIRQALDIRRRVLGDEHPDTLAAMGNLATAFFDQGRYEEAEQLYRDTLKIRRRVLGDEHPQTLNAMANLGNALWGRGHFVEAESQHREALVVLRRILGDEHPHTLLSMNNLATALDRQGRYAEAEELYRKALSVQRHVIGGEHPNTLGSMHNLAVETMRRGKYVEAEALFRETLELRRRVLGSEHSHTLSSMKNLAECLGLQGRLAEAETLFRETAEIARRTLGDKHPFLARPLVGLAEVLLENGAPHDARPLIDEALSIRRAAMPEDHSDIAYTRSVLGNCLAALGQYAEAESLVLDAHAKLMITQGKSGHETKKALANVARLYDGWGKPDKASTYRALLQTVGGQPPG